MSVNSLNRSYKLELSLSDILNLIKSFTIEDKVLIEAEIETETLKYRTKQLSKRIKPNKITMEEIVEEVKAVRKPGKMADNTFVLDSNIWISFIIKKRLNILADIIIDNTLVVINCNKMEKEISSVLQRPKFRKYISAKDVEEAIILHKKLTIPVFIQNIKKQNRDRNDDYLFALCAENSADYLVSGDNDILDSGISPPPVILTMNEFIKMFK